MDNVKELILKILKYKSDSSIDAIKVDLQRVCIQGFGNNQDGNISSVENIRNYLIKIAIIRICNQKSIQYQIENMNDPNYCINLIDKS